MTASAHIGRLGHRLVGRIIYLMNNIRNFAIIAHVDHGKSTLADRLLELTGVIKPGEHPEQFLDRHPISRERGITIKLAPVRMEYKLKVKNQKSKINNLETLNFEFWILNLIDTPGHVDFSYEVERTLACVEGVILLVDATQGIQAQTIAYLNKALEQNLVIIPVINKIDLLAAQVEKTKKQIIEFLGVKDEEIYQISARTGENVEKLLSAIVEKIPSPNKNFKSEELSSKHLRALIFDSYYDPYRGVIAFVRVFFGKIEPGTKAFLSVNKKEFQILEVGIFTPDLKPKDSLSVGEIGYVVTDLKDIHQVTVGDSIVDNLDAFPLPGYKKPKPMVYASIFPIDSDDYLSLKKALEKLSLNDSSLEFGPIYSQALGAGFRVGFLGLLHADVVQERLEREFNLNLVLTPPQVKYLVEKPKVEIENNPKGLKPKFLEPYVKITIITPSKFIGEILKLCQNHRGQFLDMDNRSLITLTYKMPMPEMITDFYDQLKSVSSGYASLDWEFVGYQPVEADKLEILLNGISVEEFSEIVVKEKSYQRASFLVKKIRHVVPRQQFEVRIQAKYQGKIIASERIAPFRKDVTQKLYGGDRTRKDKLLEKQKKGKKLMKAVGRVEIPKDAFIKLLKS